MRSNVSTRQLEAFINLAEQRSFTRAASLSHLSQPAFSALIRSLETAVGARLFDRTTRSVELTAEGAVFVDPARRLLVDAARAFGDMREHAARRRGRVSVAVLPSLAAGWLPAVLARFHAKYPGIELDVADVLSDACIQRVRSGSADFALASTRADSAELQAQPFCTDDFHVVCRRDHPLASKRRLKLADLARYPIVQLARSSSVRRQLESLPGVDRVHDLHVWASGTSDVILTAHLVMPQGHPDDRFFEDATHQLRDRFKIGHVTLQVLRVPFMTLCEGAEGDR